MHVKSEEKARERGCSVTQSSASQVKWGCAFNLEALRSLFWLAAKETHASIWVILTGRLFVQRTLKTTLVWGKKGVCVWFVSIRDFWNCESNFEGTRPPGDFTCVITSPVFVFKWIYLGDFCRGVTCNTLFLIFSPMCLVLTRAFLISETFHGIHLWQNLSSRLVADQFFVFLKRM